MNRSITVKLALSSLLLAGTAIGCKPMSASHPAALGDAAPPRAAARAARLATQAGQALAQHKPALAVTRAEAAVALAPRDASARVLLGRSYLAAGRFLSAEAALHDATLLAPADGGAILNLALAQIALGKWSDARATLAGAEGRMPDADRGLGFALAGEPDRAIAILEPAARAAHADAKTRQNLALAYAMAGRWGEARTVAAQDVAPGELDRRMSEWAVFAQPQAVWQQVATLLKVTPARDPGPPAALALAPAAVPSQQQAMAEPAPAEPPAMIAAAEPAPLPAPLPADVALAAPADAAPVFYAPPAVIPYARKAARGPVLRARMRTAPRAAAQREDGRWAVQLGAFATSNAIEAAWTRASGRTTLLAGYAPSRSQYAAFHRLALSGFATRGDATTLCVRIRATGGACFVRPVAGDTLVQLPARARGMQVASR